MARVVMVTKGACRGKRREQDEESQLSLVAFLLAAIRKSVVSCRVDRQDEVVSAAVRHMEMDIGWPANVRHVTHVTFDRFHGFLGLPVEFQVEIPCRVPSASANVFGVSPESMQCSYDSKENSIPTILLLMQERLYSQGGLKAEGIFRINPENSKEEHVRDQLNKGIVPDDIDVHCLAGLIKAWFRELPEGVLDGLSPEQVLQCNTEEESVELVKLLMPTQAALLNWAVDLMADVVEEEESNKMNARNIAMVFAPNMTQMADPLTALMHAVQVMNLLKTLIIKTLREREEAASAEEGCWSDSSSSNEQTDEEFEGQKEVDRSCTPSDSSPSSNQQIDDEFDDQKEVDMICAARICKSDEDSETYSQSSDDELDTLKEIEECFLQQLEGKDGLMNEQKTMEMNGSDLNIELGLSISETKCDTTSTSDVYSRTSIDEDASNGNPSKECYKDHNDKINEVQLMLLNKCSCDEKMNEVQLKPLNECSLACVPPNLANQEVLQLNN